LANPTSGTAVENMRFGKEGFDKPGFCKAEKIGAKVRVEVKGKPYLRNRSITIVMPRGPGPLTGKNTQE
jgi:hypothetical protein